MHVHAIIIAVAITTIIVMIIKRNRQKLSNNRKNEFWKRIDSKSYFSLSIFRITFSKIELMLRFMQIGKKMNFTSLFTKMPTR